MFAAQNLADAIERLAEAKAKDAIAAAKRGYSMGGDCHLEKHQVAMAIDALIRQVRDEVRR